jgi:hypothetical protein
VRHLLERQPIVRNWPRPTDSAFIAQAGQHNGSRRSSLSTCAAHCWHLGRLGRAVAHIHEKTRACWRLSLIFPRVIYNHDGPASAAVDRHGHALRTRACQMRMRIRSKRIDLHANPLIDRINELIGCAGREAHVAV